MLLAELAQSLPGRQDRIVQNFILCTLAVNRGCLSPGKPAAACQERLPPSSQLHPALLQRHAHGEQGFISQLLFCLRREGIKKRFIYCGACSRAQHARMLPPLCPTTRTISRCWTLTPCTHTGSPWTFGDATGSLTPSPPYEGRRREHRPSLGDTGSPSPHHLPISSHYIPFPLGLYAFSHITITHHCHLPLWETPRSHRGRQEPRYEERAMR